MILLRVLVIVLALMSRRRAVAKAILEAGDAIETGGGPPLPEDVTMEEFDNGAGLRHYLLNGYRKGLLTAKDVCVCDFLLDPIGWWPWSIGPRFEPKPDWR